MMEVLIKLFCICATENQQNARFLLEFCCSKTINEAKVVTLIVTAKCKSRAMLSCLRRRLCRLRDIHTSQGARGTGRRPPFSLVLHVGLRSTAIGSNLSSSWCLFSP